MTMVLEGIVNLFLYLYSVLEIVAVEISTR